MTTDQGESPTSGDTTEPAQAVELYFETRSDDDTETTLRSHRYRLNHFIRWCEDVRGINDFSTPTGQRLHEYRLWRREDWGPERRLTPHAVGHSAGLHQVL